MAHHFGTTRGKVDRDLAHSGKGKQHLLGIGTAMVAVHALDGEGYARCSLTAGILTTVTAIIIIVIIVALMAMTLTVLAMTLLIVTVAALLAFLIVTVALLIVTMAALLAFFFVAVTSAGTVTTESIPKCMEQQADEQDGRGDAPPRGSVLMAAI